MSVLADEAERGLLAALLMEEREWGDAHSQIFDLRKRYDIRRRKQRVRQVSQAIAEAQGTGDPARPAVEVDLRRLQQEAEAVRELALARPAPEADLRPGR